MSKLLVILGYFVGAFIATYILSTIGYYYMLKQNIRQSYRDQMDLEKSLHDYTSSLSDSRSHSTTVIKLNNFTPEELSMMDSTTRVIYPKTTSNSNSNSKTITNASSNISTNVSTIVSTNTNTDHNRNTDTNTTASEIQVDEKTSNNIKELVYQTKKFNKADVEFLREVNLAYLEISYCTFTTGIINGNKRYCPSQLLHILYTTCQEKENKEVVENIIVTKGSEMSQDNQNKLTPNLTNFEKKKQIILSNIENDIMKFEKDRKFRKYLRDTTYDYSLDGITHPFYVPELDEHVIVSKKSIQIYKARKYKFLNKHREYHRKILLKSNFEEYTSELSEIDFDNISLTASETNEGSAESNSELNIPLVSKNKKRSRYIYEVDSENTINSYFNFY
ncbi:hypothetical protein TBLA_0I01720 [Henningerozyma blattae CBS 6284]|uniref:Uncharacterized protein n=1 Tax=Henningerozyma blattae (strain ATCC 34711 / CBS 6284 / DSM 70876 / NBRC 10599 / NRRL Y-10934 / UCD 77-7) TaxID=1071380 RepID=I2H8X8_HENB6|nr:hypothetical protein TBLA_0I01720 [Tetrapisispora blattae CBS 6284]CCH62830.1 hypothetical protein TBLA_0I01720 [Tetrapisispora blattae CBS 6284]